MKAKTRDRIEMALCIIGAAALGALAFGALYATLWLGYILGFKM